MRSSFLLATCLLVAACGRPLAESTPTTTTQSSEASQGSNAAVVGHWQFGPTVAKGFAGIPGRLADLTLKADGTLEMNYGQGCLISGVEGTWTQAAPSTFTLNRDLWTDEQGHDVAPTGLRATHVPWTLLTPEGLRIDFTDDQGHAVSQFWDKAAE